MKKKFFAIVTLVVMLLGMSSCSLIGTGNSLGKTNNTAVTISKAMNGYLAKKKKENYSLYGIEMMLNSDSNGLVKLYYSAVPSEQVEYADIYVAEVDSKTGHVERFEKANYAKDGIIPYQFVKENDAFDAATLPVDSGKALSVATRAFSTTADFYYDYIQVRLVCVDGVEQYELRLISMLNDLVYCCNVDAVSGDALEVSTEPLE